MRRGLHNVRNAPVLYQYVISIGCILLTAGVCWGLQRVLDYKFVALVFMLPVTVIAVSMDIWPVVISTSLSAFIWNFFFIPPVYTLHITKSEDLVLFVMYFVVATVSGVLTFKVREYEKRNRKKQERVQTARLYNTLLNSLSHELKTPIATIIGATDTLRDENIKLSAQNKYTLIQEIATASLRLNQQVENLMNMSRIESGVLKPKFDWCDINEIVYECIRRIDEKHHTQKITVNISADIPLVWLDKMMLEQIAFNLLINACVHTPRHSKVMVSATCINDVFMLDVEDNGPGFLQEDRLRIFDKFFRAQHTEAAGTGLGLSIVKGFAEALGGNVELKNIVSGGAHFCVKIRCEAMQVNKRTEPWLIRKY
jgi:two-component system, OmpR family, sensor histidine kinase KdpD